MNTSDDLPTVKELAILAALIGGKNSDFNELANNALRLWKACESLRCAEGERLHIQRKQEEADYHEFQEVDADLQEVREFCDSKALPHPSMKEGLPQPKEFPASFDDFLRLIIGGRDTGKRLVLLRKYLQWLGMDSSVSVEHPHAESAALVASGNEVDKLKSRKFTKIDWLVEGWKFKAWHQKFRKETASAKGSLGAASRHGKSTLDAKPNKPK